ncbi:Ig-like domain-containing protein, partial [Stenotrophomonas sp.]
VINTAAVTTTTPGACTTAADCAPTVTTPITQTPKLTSTKVVTSTGPYTVGSVIAYSVSATNAGTVTLADVVVSDSKLSPSSTTCASLAPNAVCTLTGNYTVTQTDVDAGNVINTAAVTTTTPGACTTAADCAPTVTTPITQTPSLSIDKSADKTTYASVGEVITYAYLVINTGNVTINGLSVSDDKIASVSCPVTSLVAGAATTCSATYTVTQADLVAGKVTNVATANGTPTGGPLTPPTDTVTVTAQPTQIVANDDTMAPVSGSTGGNTPTVLVNDTLDGVQVTIGSVTLHSTGTGSTGTTLGLTTPPAAGSITMNPDGTLTIAPGTTAGTYTYTYEICDKLNTGNCDTAVATVVVGVSRITANDDSATTAQNTPVTVSVLGNDMLDGMPADPAKVTVTQVNPPANGSVVVNPDGTVTYTPNPGYAGTDTFTYQICENLNPANCATATVTVIVLPNSIEAIDDSGTTEQNTPVITQVIANDTTSGPRLNPGAVTIVTPSSHGTTMVNADGSVTYTPNPNFSGTDTYVYEVCDVSAPAPVCDRATVTIIVTPNRIDAIDDEATTQVDTPVTLAVLGNDTSAKVPLDPASLTVLTPPVNGTVVCSAGSCVYTPNPGYVGNDSFVYRVCDVSVPTPVCDTATATIRIEGETQVRVTKQASPRDVKVGDLVRYTVTLENVGESDVVDGTLVDTPPAGFTLVVGSLEVADRDGAGRLAGSFPIRVDQIDIAKGDRAVVTYLLRVGAGVRGGLHTNAAELHDNGRRISNVGTATVQMVADPMMDESTLLGTVFDDRDGDGWQDSADLSDIRVQGGFAAGAYIANSTTVDRGNGPQAEPDASSPMLHGIAIGKIGGRQSDADPAQARQVVVSQLLRSLDFNGDFVLTSKQGATLRMDAAGKTTVRAEGGDAANGLSAALPSVQRKVTPAEGGYRVDYIIRNDGVDERGIPGVRIASVEGLLVETDQFGRYNLIGVDGGRDDRGRNFILKVDPATLPPGSVFTTRNPLVRRITPGLPVRFDFGVKLPPGLVQGEPREKVEMELGEVMFAPASAEVRSQYLPAVEKMAEQVRSHGGGEVVIAAHGEDELLAFDRAVAVRKALVAALPADIAARTQVSLRTNTADDGSMVVGLLSWPVLGNVLFDTDKSTIKPEYTALLARIANYLVEMDTRIVKIAGHADRRASDAYNDALGMRRAKAVYDAISAQLPADQRSKVNVELIPGGPDASSGQAAKEVSP